MKTIHTYLAATILAGMSMTALAGVSLAKRSWAEGPVQFLMTKEEKAAWVALDSDAAADDFIALFWARRDPTPATPRNEFREDFEARVKAADDAFSHGRTHGSMTDPGRIAILFGPPNHPITRPTKPPSTAGSTRSNMRDAEVGSAFSSSGSADMAFMYDGELSV